MRISDWSSDVCSSDLPIFRHVAHKCVTTLHGRHDLPDYWPVFRNFPEMSLVSISDAQRTPMPDANFVATIHHGLPETLIPFSPEGGDYLAFIGRISPEKRPDRAIELATRAGVRSEWRRVGKGCVSTCSARWAPNH